MATSPNFSWPEPDNTDLVKNGALAIRTAINAIDTSMVDLKGGTTGQVLSKASGTDLDFSWVAVDPLTILDAKGDLITATAADTPARLAVGATNGMTLQVDSSTATGLKWDTPSSGGMTLLSTTTLSGSSTSITSISQSYTNLLIEMYNPTNATADGTSKITVHSLAGTQLFYAGVDAGTAFIENGGVGISPRAASDRNNSVGLTFSVLFLDYTNTVQNKLFEYSYYNRTTTSTNAPGIAAGIVWSTNAVQNLYFQNTGGNFTGGTVKIWGVK